MVVMATALIEESLCVLADISNFSKASLVTRRGEEAAQGSSSNDYIMITSLTLPITTLHHCCNETQQSF